VPVKKKAAREAAHGCILNDDHHINGALQERWPFGRLHGGCALDAGLAPPQGQGGSRNNALRGERGRGPALRRCAGRV
jgi:hypothetical protein